MNSVNSFSFEQDFSRLIPELTASQFRGCQASFVLLDTKTSQYFRFNTTRCGARLSPCSTFKIFNALVGLETGVLQDENHSMSWDGTKYVVASWNQDHTLQSAMTNSVVWYFQRVAASVNEERMRQFIAEANYGNQDISGGITKFWLGSSLKISADEQVEFIKRLVNDELPFSKRSMAIVRGLIRLAETPKGTLCGKTGTDRENGKNLLGWFVGYIAQPGRTYVFATNIEDSDDAWGPRARQLTEKILTEARIL